MPLVVVNDVGLAKGRPSRVFRSMRVARTLVAVWNTVIVMFDSFSRPCTYKICKWFGIIVCSL